MRTRGEGVKKSEIFADVLNLSPLATLALREREREREFTAVVKNPVSLSFMPASISHMSTMQRPSAANAHPSPKVQEVTDVRPNSYRTDFKIIFFRVTFTNSVLVFRLRQS